jgi:hypothetical protein
LVGVSLAPNLEIGAAFRDEGGIAFRLEFRWIVDPIDACVRNSQIRFAALVQNICRDYEDRKGHDANEDERDIGPRT